MQDKITILFMSDYGDTGFGTVGKELTARWAEMEIFDVHYLGWHATPNHVPVAARDGVKLHTTRFWDNSDQFGKHSLEPLIKAIQPQIVITLGDPWMIDHTGAVDVRKGYTWIAYIPIDRDVVCKPWLDMMKGPDCLVLYSKFGMEVIESQMPFRNPRLILHGVDKSVFHPWYPDGTDEDTPLPELMAKRKEGTLGAGFGEKFVVGFLGRNQIRKAIPRVMKSFKAFNCATWIERQQVNVRDENGEISERHDAEDFCREKQCFRCDICPAFQQRQETVKSIIYLHTTDGSGKEVHDRPGIGWRIEELGHRLGLKGRIGITPNLKALQGLPREALAQIMNCFDVHCFLSHSEGYGLPICESLACGVPTLVTNYSSMPELVSDGGGVCIDVRDYDTFVTWENEWANADIGHAADEINKIFVDTEYATEMRKAAAENAYTPDWHDVALQFRHLMLEAMGEEES